MSAGSNPTNLKSEGSAPAILSEEGKKRYFICHGGPPVSKDGVTLEEVAKIDRYVYLSRFDWANGRYGRQPGHEGLMCEVRFPATVG
jgi:serine/threonine-protein phosphatase 5